MRTQPIALLHKFLSCNSETGILTWKVTRGAAKAGERAGTLCKDGYRRVIVKWKSLLEHRVIFAMVNNYWPELEVDHKNLIRDDNRIDNLRLATDSQNNSNSSLRVDNTSGFKGVGIHQGKFAANIRINGKQKRLGSYNTAEEASEVYQAAALEVHGEFARF